jgi:ribokinase
MARPEPSRGGRLVVVGSYLRDLGLAIDRFPLPGETRVGHDFLESHGGKGSNQAVQAARCGVPVAMIAAVGADPAGRAARALWTAEGIDVGAVVERADRPTGVAMILVDQAAQNQIAFDLGANMSLEIADIERAAPALAAAALVVAQCETPFAATARAFELAQRAGALTLLNPAPAPPELPDALWRRIDVMVANELEAASLAGVALDTDPRAVGTVLLPRVRRALVITIGQHGAWLFEPGRAPLHHAALAVEAIDSTGAGDAFIGAFAARYLATGELAAALGWGIAAGGLACTRRGVVPALARGPEIEAAAPS